MFLSREYRARAVGLLAAYAVVITGLIVGAALEPSAKGASKDTHPTAERQQPNTLEDPTSADQKRCDTVC
jgi:hypothetical protein